MSRFFVEPDRVTSDGRIIISGTDVNHMKNVLRMKKGDALTVCDSTGTEYGCELDSFEKDAAVCLILSSKPGMTEPRTPVTLLQGVPKGDKMELIIQKNIELGVNRIIPVMMERTVVRFSDGKDAAKKAERWRRIAGEASKQCGRLKVPEITDPMTLKQALALINGEPRGLRIVPYENEADRRLKSALKGAFGVDPIPNISFLIGPEGGISEAEMELLEKEDFTPVSLGRRILRTETAGFAVMAAIRYELED